jgi:hypothetical protein
VQGFYHDAHDSLFSLMSERTLATWTRDTTDTKIKIQAENSDMEAHIHLMEPSYYLSQQPCMTFTLLSPQNSSTDMPT